MHWGDSSPKRRNNPGSPIRFFLITADHCASSAGRTEIPLEKYHIPALIYAPGFVEPQHVGGIVSQIDLMPTLLSLLNMSYDSRAIGYYQTSSAWNKR